MDELFNTLAALGGLKLINSAFQDNMLMAPRGRKVGFASKTPKQKKKRERGEKMLWLEMLRWHKMFRLSTKGFGKTYG